MAYFTFTAGTHADWCESWAPNYTVSDDWYSLDWNPKYAGPSHGVWRSLDFVLLQGKYRCKCFSYTFYAHYATGQNTY